MRSPEMRAEAREACASIVRETGGRLVSEAIQVLSTDPSKEATADLLSLLDRAPQKKAEIYAALAGRQDPSAVDALVARATRGGDADVIAALAGSGDVRALPSWPRRRGKGTRRRA